MVATPTHEPERLQRLPGLAGQPPARRPRHQLGPAAARGGRRRAAGGHDRRRPGRATLAPGRFRRRRRAAPVRTRPRHGLERSQRPGHRPARTHRRAGRAHSRAEVAERRAGAAHDRRPNALPSRWRKACTCSSSARPAAARRPPRAAGCSPAASTPRGRQRLLALDPKGDEALEADLRAIAAKRGRPFVLFDPFDPDTDRWNPIWADDPGAVVARLVAPVEADSDSDASHYSRVLRVHLGLVAEALHAAGRWPIALPVLLRCAQRNRFARHRRRSHESTRDDDLRERLDDHRTALEGRATQNQLEGSLRALEVVAGQAWRRVLTPAPQRGAVTLPAAMAAGVGRALEDARRGHQRRSRDDHHARTRRHRRRRAHPAPPGRVGAADRRVRQRAPRPRRANEPSRSCNAPAAHTARSPSPPNRSPTSPSATGNEQLLGVAGRQLHRLRPAPPDLSGESRLARHAARHPRGLAVHRPHQRRRAPTAPDRADAPPSSSCAPTSSSVLRTGEAVVWTTLAPQPEKVHVQPGPRLAPGAIDSRSVYRPVPMDTLAAALAPPEPSVPERRRSNAADNGDPPAGALFRPPGEGQG